jgi:hypothetical protein
MLNRAHCAQSKSLAAIETESPSAFSALFRVFRGSKRLNLRRR